MMSVFQADAIKVRKSRFATMALALAGVALFAARGEATPMVVPKNAEDFPSGTIFFENEDGSVTAKLPNGQIILIAEQDVILFETGEWQIANFEIYGSAVLADADDLANGIPPMFPSIQGTGEKPAIDAVEKNFYTIQLEDEEYLDNKSGASSDEPSSQPISAEEIAKILFNDDGTFSRSKFAAFAGLGMASAELIEQFGGMSEKDFAAILRWTPGDLASNTPPEFTSDTTASVAENTTGIVYTATATDADDDIVTFTIAGGADAAAFSIDPATGALRMVNTPDYENPGDAGEVPDNVYEVIIQASDGADTTSQTVSVTVDNVDEAPVFSSATTASVAENQSFAYAAVATDPENETVSYSLSGVDAGRFNIDPSTGVVTFADHPNFENPNDDGNDNVYNFTVTASDGDNTSNQDVAITVTDVEPEEPDSQVDFGKSGNVVQDDREEISFINQSDEAENPGGFVEYFDQAGFVQLGDAFGAPEAFQSASGPGQFDLGIPPAIDSDLIPLSHDLGVAARSGSPLPAQPAFHGNIDLFAVLADPAQQMEPLTVIDTVEGW